VPLADLCARVERGLSDAGQNLSLNQVHNIHLAATLPAPEARVPAPADLQDPLGFDSDVYPLMNRVRLPKPLPTLCLVLQCDLTPVRLAARSGDTRNTLAQVGLGSLQ
jgi:hypothetical protein